jgi:arylsulfatase A-like enzyme
MTRASTAPSTVAAASLVSLLLFSACTGERADPMSGPGSRPNVLIFITDDQRSDMLPALPRTLEWFRPGTRYPNAVSTTPLCCPSRASVFTGRYAHNHGVLTNHHGERLDARRTVQSALRRAGYRTAIAGKYLNEWPLERPPPMFDQWAIDSPFPYGNGYLREPFNVNGELREVPYATDFIARAATGFLRDFERQDPRPWFVYVAPFAPHEPAIPPPGRPTPAPRVPGLPEGVEEPPQGGPHFLPRTITLSSSELRALAADQVRALGPVDELVNRVMSAVESLGELDRTLAFFLSDNGYLLGDHGAQGKSLPYMESVRIPLLVRWPAAVDRPAVDDRLAANVDIAPTILEAAGLPGALPVDGRSLTGRPRTQILLESFRTRSSPIPSWTALLTRGWEYVEYSRMGRHGFAEYYDLRGDPGQTRNLVSDAIGAERLSRLKDALEALRRCGSSGAAKCP